MASADQQKTWNIKDLVGQKVEINYELESQSNGNGKARWKWLPGTLLEVFDNDLAEVSFDNLQVSNSITLEVNVNQIRPRKVKGGNSNGNGNANKQVPVVPSNAAGPKSYADLLKPPPPPPVKAAPEVATASAAAGGKQAAAKPAAGAFDYEKFTKYVQFVAADHAAQLFRPTDEDLTRIRDVTLTNHFNERSAERYAENLQELKRSLNSTQDCFMYRETRYAIYLPTVEEIDIEAGWEVRNGKKQSFEGSFVVFSSNFTRVFEVSDREKGEKKTRNATQINAIQMEAEKPTEKNGKSLIERAKAAIAEWNVRAARKTAEKTSELRPIHFNDAATNLLSTALESCHELSTFGMVSTTTTCILSHDLATTITCFKNNIRYAAWIERERQQAVRKVEQGRKKKDKSEGNSKPRNNQNGGKHDKKVGK